MVLFAFGMFYQKAAAEKSNALEKLTAGAAPVLQSEQPLKKEMNLMKASETEGRQLNAWLQDSVYWADILRNLREVFQEVEDKTAAELSKPDAKVDAGLWVEKLKPGLLPGERASSSAAQNRPGAPATPRPSGARPKAGAPPMGDPDKQMREFTLVCRGINLRNVAPAADNQMAYAIAEAIKGRTNYFDADVTRLNGDLLIDPDELTFTFEVVVGLKRPISL
jgi:hypothetical protein